MGKVDTVTKAYMRKNNIFADAFNYLIYEGKTVVEPERLREVDTTEIALPFGPQENGQSNDLVQKYRDILKSAVVMQEDEAAYILLGIENQTDIRGIEIGEFRMLVKQVKKGRLTIEEAAEDAAMSVEEFRNVTDDMLKEG